MVFSNLLEISGLTVEYQTGRRIVRALDNVSLTISEIGNTLGIVGESGSGKTTLGLSIMKAIEPPGQISGGTIRYLGREILDLHEKELRAYRWKEVSMVYQSAMNSLNPVKKASDHLVEVLREHVRISKKEARERALKLLHDVGIGSDHATDYSHQMSGGMRQRVVIALALTLFPKLLIADEPTSALDVVVQQQILSLLRKEIVDRGLSLLFITHEISLLCGLVQDVAVMFGGEIVENGPTDKVLFEPLHPYTELLLSKHLSLKSNFEEMLADSKKSPATQDLKFSVNACKYVSLCKYAFDRCRRERPLLFEVEKGRWVSCHKFN